MKTFTVLVIALVLGGCSSMQARNEQQETEKAIAAAKAAGNSGPLYEHYETCLNRNWQHELDAGKDPAIAYDAGIGQCTVQLSALCDFYGVPSCYKDAKLVNKILYSLMLEDYLGITRNSAAKTSYH
jgi:hypothetical protein